MTSNKNSYGAGIRLFMKIPIIILIYAFTGISFAVINSSGETIPLNRRTVAYNCRCELMSDTDNM